MASVFTKVIFSLVIFNILATLTHASPVHKKDHEKLMVASELSIGQKEEIVQAPAFEKLSGSRKGRLAWGGYGYNPYYNNFGGFGGSSASASASASSSSFGYGK